MSTTTATTADDATGAGHAAPVDPAVLEDVRALLVETLGLPNDDEVADASSELFGRIPELDSLAVVELMVALEERFEITIDDEDVSTEVFGTVGSLVRLVEQRRRDRSGGGGS